MTKASKNKTKFRATSKWKKFRAFMKKIRKVDALTGSPLRKGWQLHHCCMQEEHYQELEEDNFECLNRKSHETVHFIFATKDWRKTVENLVKIMEKMEELNNDTDINERSV